MQTDEAPGGYIRGGAGVVDTRGLFRVLLGCVIVALAAFVVVLTIAAAHQNSRIHNLQHRGVPVDVTVTRCLGILSGTGVTVTSFQCSGSYVLAGRSYNAVIGGSSTNHAAGDVVKAIADPKHPTSLSTPSSLANSHSSWRPFIGAGILFLVLVLLIAAAVWWSRRKSAQRPSVDAPMTISTTGSATTEAVASTDSSPPAFTTPVLMFVALLLLVIARALWWFRHNSAQRPPGGDALG
jgi:cobalamin biosynthesis Mg chelatase CobN